jgi:glycosyltransferase involved in cell wall biosynthesis
VVLQIQESNAGMLLAPISIVVPTYNRAHLITRALRSVVNECSPDDQIIVVDDGSTDDTERVVAGFQNVRYEKIAHGGAGRARNAGVALAHNRLVGFLDSDDEFLPGTLACKRALMSTRRDLVFCFSDFSGKHVGKPLEPGCLVYWSHDPRSWDEILAPGTPLSGIAANACGADPLVHIGSMYRAEMASSYIAANTVIVNRELAGDALLFPEDLPTYEDWECFGRVTARGPCAFIAFDSAIQHVHGEPRLTDATKEVEFKTRLKVLERVWGTDRAFLSLWANEYERVCNQQRLIGAKLMLRAGRQSEARTLLQDLSGGPLWARLARYCPVPRFAIRLMGIARRGSRS